MIQPKSISIIIPNFNGSELLKDYLPMVYDALKSSAYISDFEIIIIDDASSDNSIQFLSTNYPDIILLQNSENLGFSKTINKGIFSSKMELILLLNTDMALSKNIFDHLIPHFSTDSSIFGVSPTIYNKTGDLILEGQKTPLFKKNTISYLDNTDQTQPCNSLYLCGGCALVSKEKLLQLNGFNEIYSPFYFEDFDLSVRAWLKGWKCLYIPDAHIFHCHSVTINTHFDKEHVEKIFIRNRLLFNYLYLDGFGCFLFSLKNYVKYVLGKILPSKSKTTFNSAFKAYQEMRERKKIRKELMRYCENSLDKILSNYFPQSKISFF